MADRTNTHKQAATSRKAGGASKMDLVRKALAKLGKDAKPTQIQDYVKSAFSVRMTADHVSNYKGKILRGETGKVKAPSQKKSAKVNKHPARKVTASRQLATVTTGSTSHTTGKGLTLQDVHTTRDLLGRVGATQLRSLLDLLSK